MWHLLCLVSIRHLLGSPLRSALTVLGVAVGVATMVGIAAINHTILAAFRSTIDTIAGKADLTVAAGTAGFDDGLVEKVRTVPGVLHASGGLTVIAPVHGSPGESLYVMGVDLLDDGYFRNWETRGRDIGALAEDLEFLNSTDRMLVSERFAAEHQLEEGSTFQVVTPSGVKDFTVHGLIKESGPVKAFGGSVAVMYVGSAQEAFGRGRNIDRIDVAVDPKREFEEMRQRLREAVGPSFEIERPSRRGGSVEKMVRSFQLGLNFGSAVALLVGVFLVYNTVAIGVIQRRREIGTLRAIGATRTRLRWMFTLEALVIGAIGTALGLPLGVVLARLAVGEVSDTVSSIYVQVNARDVELGALELGLGLVLGLLGSAFAALRPSWVASRVHPVEALRRDVAAGAAVSGLNRTALLGGAAFTAVIWPLTLIPAPIENVPLGGYLAVFSALMATTLLSPLWLRSLQPVFARPGQWLLGVSGRLAADNFARAPTRTAVPVSALATGVAMTVAIGAFVGSFRASSLRWIDQSVPADLFVTASSKIAGIRNVPLPPELGRDIERMPGVEAVDFVRLFQHDVLDLRVYLISLRPEVYYPRGKLTVLEGRLPTPEERRALRVSISENLARRRNLHPGDTFPLHTPSGVKTLTVAAVIVEYTSDQGAVYLDRDLFVDWFRDDRVDSFEVYLADDTRLEEVRRTILARFGAQHDLYVLSNAELRHEAVHLIDAAFTLTYAMEAVAVLLALLGVINTLLAAVIDRTREIGLLRAIGAARAHVIRLFTGEAALIGISGGILGVLAGTVIGLLVTRVVGVQSTGWSFRFVFPTSIASQMVVAASVCAVIAGVYPAQRAARLDVVEALAYE
ncbi:MAG TPA: FtsX-like permease family protein [Myxococcaceae bacterium]|nr:FtsX-like permease family protein [Myxococcaceae bacterium]